MARLVLICTDHVLGTSVEDFRNVDLLRIVRNKYAFIVNVLDLSNRPVWIERAISKYWSKTRQIVSNGGDA